MVINHNSGIRTKIEKELEPNKIYIAQLDRSKNKRSLGNGMDGLWIFDNKDNIDPITQDEIKKDIEYLGILIVIVKKEENLRHSCWEPICNHIFDYDSLKDWIQSDSFTGCPIFRAGRPLTNTRYVIGAGLMMESEETTVEDELFNAVRDGDLNLVQYLIEDEDANVNQFNNDGYTALIKASEHRYLYIVRYWIEHNGVVNHREWRMGWTALTIALAHGHQSVVQYLVENTNVDINKRNNEGETV